MLLFLSTLLRWYTGPTYPKHSAVQIAYLHLWICLLYSPCQHDYLIKTEILSLYLCEELITLTHDFRGASAAWHEEVQVYYSFTSCPADVMRTCWMSKHGHWDSLNQQYNLQCEQQSLLSFLIRPFCFRYFGSAMGCYSRSMLISLSLHFKLSTRNCLVFYIFKNKENPSIWLFYSDALQRFSCTLLSHRFTSPQSQLQRLLDMHDKLPCLSRFFCWISLNLPIVFNNFNSYSFTTNFFWSYIDSDFHGLC